MAEIFRVDVPCKYDQLSDLANKVDILKRIAMTIKRNCVLRNCDEFNGKNKRKNLEQHELQAILNAGPKK